jgi:catechol 2,3-dioxygenase-like lactoylglutathione lyase family enzyme
MPRLDGILEVALYVDDLDRSIRFYQATLGFEVIAASERLVALGVVARQLLLICHRTASAHLPQGAHDASGEQHVAFAVPAADLDAWKAKLAELAVPIEEARHWSRGGDSIYFRDPDRHLIELATPGVWSNY